MEAVESLGSCVYTATDEGPGEIRRRKDFNDVIPNVSRKKPFINRNKRLLER